MRSVASVYLTLPEEPDHVLCAVAVPDGANVLRAKLAPQLLYGLLDYRVNPLGIVLLQPGLHVITGRLLEWHRIPAEEVRDDAEVAIGGVLVGDELVIEEGRAVDVGQVDDRVRCRFVFGVGNVCIVCDCSGQSDIPLGHESA